MEMLRTVIVALFFAGITVSSYYFLSSSPFPWETPGVETAENGISSEGGLSENGGERTFAQDGPFAPPASDVSMNDSELPQLEELLPQDALPQQALPQQALPQQALPQQTLPMESPAAGTQNTPELAGYEQAAVPAVRQDPASGYAQEMNADLESGGKTMPLKAPESDAYAYTQDLPPLENAPVSPFDSAPNAPGPVAVQPELQIGTELNGLPSESQLLPQTASETAAPLISDANAGALPMTDDLHSAAPALSGTNTDLPAGGSTVPAAVPVSENAEFTNPLRSQSVPAAPAIPATPAAAQPMNAPMNAQPAPAAALSVSAVSEENVLPLPSASEMPENTVSAPAAQNVSDDQAVREYLKIASEKMQKGEALEVLRAMSRFYGDSRYSAEDLAKLTNILVQAATQVIYSQQSFLEPAYVIQPGDTLEKIAAQYQIPVEFIARVNGIQAPYELQPGTQLKVVRGPFQAIVWLDRHEMVLTLRGLFAGRFWIGVGGDLAMKDGDFRFGQKIIDPAALSNGNGFEFVQFAGDGNPTLKVHAADASLIGTNAPHGGILMTQVDIDSLGALLGPGSQLIMRCVSPKYVVKSAAPSASVPAASVPAASAPNTGTAPLHQAVGSPVSVPETTLPSPAPAAPAPSAAPIPATEMDEELPDTLPGTMPSTGLQDNSPNGLQNSPQMEQMVIPAEGGAGELPDELPPML